MATLIVTLIITLGAFGLLWLWSLRVVDASIVDIYWGPGFAIIGWIAYGMAEKVPFPVVLLLLAITLWALRLGWYIGRRHKGEDARYKAMRDAHGPAFAARSLWMVFGLQSIVQWLASSPILVAMLAPAQMMMPILAIGIALFSGGFLLEALADREVERFKSDPANKGKLLATGLHAHIRHPNYLGEIVVQWGFGLMAFGATQQWLAFVGPILMTALIVRLSGVPMLEAQLSSRPGYAEWKSRSGALFPKW